MVEQNRTRMDFKERFEEMIKKYSNYNISVEMQLEEQVRQVRKNLSEEQLAVPGIVTQYRKIQRKRGETKS